VTAVPAPDPGPDAGAIWHYGDPFGEQRAAETVAVLVDRSHRAVLTLTAPDRLTWLHTLCAQHVTGGGEVFRDLVWARVTSA
jgi:glycine cleavage system aminomethyltransferase T